MNTQRQETRQETQARQGPLFFRHRTAAREGTDGPVVDRYRVSAILDQSSIDRAVSLEKPSAEQRNPHKLAPTRTPMLLCDAKKRENPVGLEFPVGFPVAGCY